MLRMTPSYYIEWSDGTLRVTADEIGTICTVLTRSGIDRFTVTANKTWDTGAGGKSDSAYLPPKKFPA